MIGGGKARKNQKISEIKRWSVSRQALAGDLHFLEKKLIGAENLPHIAPQKNICEARVWIVCL
jgi:hypothetical protein